MAPTFDPATDVGSLADKVVLLTGGTGGIGKEAVIHLASLTSPPAYIYFTGRDVKRANDLIALLSTSSACKVSFLECDLTSFASVRAAADKFKVEQSRLDILICNAGIMDVPPGLTKDGYEIQFGTNHLGHALLFAEVEPTLTHTALTFNSSKPRITILSSEGYGLHPKGGILWDDLKKADCGGNIGGGWVRYGQSKLANILFGQEIARRYPSFTTAIIHPGVVKTDLVSTLTFWSKLLVYVTNGLSMLTPAQGAFNTVWGATSKDVVSGAYYRPVGKKVNKLSTKEANGDAELAAKLWKWTEGELKNIV